MNIIYSRMNYLCLAALTTLIILFVVMPARAAIHHIDFNDNNKIIVEPRGHESLIEPLTGLNSTSELPILDLTPNLPQQIDTSSDNVFDRGYNSVRQWTYDFLLEPSQGDKSSGFTAVFKVLGLFIVLSVLFVIRRLVKLRRLKAQGRDTTGQYFSNPNFK